MSPELGNSRTKQSLQNGKGQIGGEGSGERKHQRNKALKEKGKGDNIILQYVPRVWSQSPVVYDNSYNRYRLDIMQCKITYHNPLSIS